MKTLIVNGSPRKNGDTVSLINEMKKYLKGEVRQIDAYYDNISPCFDCRYCWQHDSCSIKDEMQEVYQILDEVDNIILASPVYFSELTGKLLDFASRLQFFYAKKQIRKDFDFKLKKKNAVLILAGGGDGSPEPAKRSANIIFKYINAELTGTVLSLQTDIIPSHDDVGALYKARELALKLNEMYETTTE